MAILRLRRAVTLLLRGVALLLPGALGLSVALLLLAVRWSRAVSLAILLEGGLVGGGVGLVLFVVGGVDGAEEHFEGLRRLG